MLSDARRSIPVQRSNFEGRWKKDKWKEKSGFLVVF